jgi:hypothetical protein
MEMSGLINILDFIEIMNEIWFSLSVALIISISTKQPGGVNIWIIKDFSNPKPGLIRANDHKQYFMFHQSFNQLIRTIAVACSPNIIVIQHQFKKIPSTEMRLACKIKKWNSVFYRDSISWFLINFFHFGFDEWEFC